MTMKHPWPIHTSDQIDKGDRNYRVLFLGTCAAEPMAGNGVDHILWESFEHAPVPDIDTERYDALAVSLTLRHILDKASPGANNDLYWPRCQTDDELQDYLERCTSIIDVLINKFADVSRKIPVIFASLLEPRSRIGGLTLPRYALSNPTFFVNQINQYISNRTDILDNHYFLDTNDDFSSIGRDRIQDDYLVSWTHASFIADFGLNIDEGRLQPFTPPSVMYDSNNPIKAITNTIRRRLFDMLTVIKQPSPIKLIILDMDDTLWRGVAADQNRPLWELVEGWPLGLVEAVLMFKRQGGVLAVCSKNDDATAREHLHRIYGERLSSADFASLKISFGPKSIAIKEILSEVNVLAANTLFIDDNPREIDEVRSQLPELRILSREHYDWRRSILLSPDTQVARITAESTLRTTMIKAKIQRDTAAKTLSRAEWLDSLELRQKHGLIRTTSHSDFARAFELINKTNQFNTTGKRWTHSELEELLSSGGYLLTTRVRDRTVDNGLVGVVIVNGHEILQSVLSCRIFNLDVEIAMGRVAMGLMLDEHTTISGAINDTGKNATCHNFFKRLGFIESGSHWTATQMPKHPPHIIADYDTDAEISVISTDCSKNAMSFQCRVKNCSSTIWYEDKYQVNLSGHLLNEEGEVLEWDGPRTLLCVVQAPDAERMVSLTYDLSRIAGAAQLQLDPVHEMRSWFSARGVHPSVIRLRTH